jgi:hypothetical protein
MGILKVVSTPLAAVEGFCAAKVVVAAQKGFGRPRPPTAIQGRQALCVVFNDRQGKQTGIPARPDARPAYFRSKPNPLNMADMNPNPATPAARPTLLTVICIISFIMGAWGVISGIMNMTKDQTAVLAEAQAKMEEAKAQMGDQANGMAGRWMDEGMAMAQRASANAVPIGVAGILLSLLSLFGVWRMWNLQKSGFWIYLLATILSLAVPLYFLGGGLLAVASVGFIGFFSLIFIILYAVNLKYMH